MDQEEQYKKDLEAAGVEVPEAEVAKELEKEPEPAKEAPTEKEPAKEPEKEEPAPLQDESKPHNRSIYDDYKDKKLEVKTEKERADAAERERDELKEKLEAVGKAETPEEKKEAADDLDKFAKKINADPSAIREMRDLFLKDVKPALDESTLKDLQEFKAWKTQNAGAVEKQRFDEEFQQSAPKLKDLFPTASPEEMTAIKTELDTISHTKDWHDKSLAYIAFEHKDKLTALVSPKKRGMESNGRKPDAEVDSFEFDPSADYSKLSPTERVAWEAEYGKATKSEGLVTGANGKKIIL